MSTYRSEVPPLAVFIIPADAGDLGWLDVDALFVQRNLAQSDCLWWENFDVTPQMLLSVPSLFFMEKEDAYPAPFLIPSSSGVHVTWDQTSDGYLKTSITNLKTLPWAIREHRCTHWGGYEHTAPMCLVYLMMAGLSSKSPSLFSLRKTLSWIVAFLQAAGDRGLWQVVSLGDDSMSDLDTPMYCGNPNRHHAIKRLGKS